MPRCDERGVWEEGLEESDNLGPLVKEVDILPLHSGVDPPKHEKTCVGVVNPSWTVIYTQLSTYHSCPRAPPPPSTTVFLLPLDLPSNEIPRILLSDDLTYFSVKIKKKFFTANLYKSGPSLSY